MTTIGILLMCMSNQPFLRFSHIEAGTECFVSEQAVVERFGSTCRGSAAFPGMFVFVAQRNDRFYRRQPSENHRNLSLELKFTLIVSNSGSARGVCVSKVVGRERMVGCAQSDACSDKEGNAQAGEKVC
jgi:hypothetical protein